MDLFHVKCRSTCIDLSKNNTVSSSKAQQEFDKKYKKYLTAFNCLRHCTGRVNTSLLSLNCYTNNIHVYSIHVYIQWAYR